MNQLEHKKVMCNCKKFSMTTSGIIQAISGEEDQYFSVQQVTGLNLYEECETGLEYHRLYSLPKEIFEKILWLYTKRWAGENMNKIKEQLQRGVKLLLCVTETESRYPPNPLNPRRELMDLHAYHSFQEHKVIVNPHNYIYYPQSIIAGSYQFVRTLKTYEGNIVRHPEDTASTIMVSTIKENNISESYLWTVCPQSYDCRMFIKSIKRFKKLRQCPTVKEEDNGR